MSLCYDFQKWIIICLACVTISLAIGLVALMSVHGQSNDTNQTGGIIKVEGTGKRDNGGDYRLYGTFFMSPNSNFCPSNQCKLIPIYSSCTPSPDTSMFLTYPKNQTAMTFGACFRLQDNITNANLTPEQKNLVEPVYFGFMCSFDDVKDIQELKNGTTKYQCSNDFDPSAATRTFNQTNYPYAYNMTLEIPSGHFVLNAQEVE
jgi:hypothetical protein